MIYKHLFVCNNVKRNKFVDVVLEIENNLSKYYLDQKMPERYKSFLLNLDVTGTCVNLLFFHVGSKGKCRSICLKQMDIIEFTNQFNLFIGNCSIDIKFESYLDIFKWSSEEINVVLSCLKTIGIQSV